MLIAIDATAANKKNRTGVEWYAYHLIQNLKEIIPADQRVVLFSADHLLDDLKLLPENWESRVLTWPLKKGWTTIRLNWELWRRPPDLFFMPANRLPIFSPIKTITTIHDIGPNRIPEKYETKTRQRITRATKTAVKRAAKIIAISEFTKRELMEKFQIAPERVMVIPLAADQTRFRPASESEKQSILAKYRLSRNYFFHIGRLEAKKNIVTLLRAFEIFKKQQGIGDPFQLVLAGAPGYSFATIEQFIKRSEVKDQIRLLGYVPEQDVPWLIGAATLYVFPSWYEGFGIPALEAMACATPVLASDIGALREVASDAAEFAPPGELERWAEAMRESVNNSWRREELVAKGLLHVQQFSWKKTAEQTWQVFSALFTSSSVL